MGLSYTLFDIANSTAKDLLEIGAVSFSPEKPFEFTSGRLSPIYVDVRQMLGVSSVRARLSRLGASFIYQEIGSENFDVIAGGETAGIPIAALISDRMQKPLCYIRKKPKGFGRNAQIEGLSDTELDKNQRFLLVEDLCSDGGSKISFAESVRKTGNTITDAFVVFSYNCFGADNILADCGIKLHAMVDAAKLLEVAEDIKAFPSETVAQVKIFIESQFNS